MIVIDASTLAKFLLREPGYREVKQYLIRGAYSVDQVVKEVSNAIWKYAILFRRLRREDARECYIALLKLIEGRVVIIEPQEKYIDQAFDIALSHEITVYDALYIAQARVRGLKLLTSDRIQAETARKLGIEVLHI